MRTLLIIAIFFSTSSLLGSTIFTLNRVNYKPHKTLYYDLKFDSTTCKIGKLKSLDVYYLAGPKRIDLSFMSRKFFSPDIFKNRSDKTHLEFSFYALREFMKEQKRDDQAVKVDLIKNKGGCIAKAKVVLAGKVYILSNITINFKTIFGQPYDVDWLNVLIAEEKKGATQITKCLIGKCG